MPGVPSNKACDRCKKRHVKCDEGRPGCQRCVAAGVDCPGYSQDRKFIDQGATVRRRYAPYQRNETRAQSSDRRLSTEEQDKEETSRPSVPTPGSRRSIGADNQMNHSTSDYFGSASGNQTPLQSETNLVSTSPYADLTASTGFLNAPQTVPDVPNTESLTFANPFDPFNSINSMQPPNLYGSNFENQTGLGSTVGTNYPFIDSQYSTVGNTNAVGDLYSELMINSERETAFLSRHYVEFIAPWLDLHDSEKFFAQTIPRRSIFVPFIQSSILAIAAKHLARINGTKPLQDSKSRPATTETYPNVTSVNWQFKATHYFCQALLHMRQLVSGQVDSQQLDTTASPIHILCRDLEINVTSESAGPAVMPPTFVSNVDDIYPGLVILTLSDILDQPGTEWETRFLGLGHLLKCLLSFTGSHQNQTLMVSHALRASFWNLAYLDCFAAYANRRRTRVDAYNFDLFRAAGIPLDNQGLLNLYNADNSLTVRPSSQRDDMFFRGITFIILKLMNFLAEFMEIQQAASTAASPVPDFLSNASVPQSSRLAVKWHQLLQEVSSWHNALPDTFQPYIQIQNPHDFLSATSASSPSLPFPEIVFSSATHASTMAVYNFARIILLLNRPYESQHTARDRLVEYREVTKQVDECTHELAGIAMGRTAPAVQIHFTQLLYVVGLCDDRPEAREKVVELLRGIRTEHGWETDYKIAQMQAMWNKG